MNESAERSHMSHHLSIYISTSCILLLQLFLSSRNEVNIEYSQSSNLLLLSSVGYIIGIFYSLQHQLNKLTNTWLMNISLLMVGWIAYQVDIQTTLKLHGGLSVYAIDTKFEFINISRPEMITSMLIISGIISCLSLWHKHKLKKALLNTTVGLYLPIQAE